jgi:tetratricopeptide (TPR) repeat protein
MLVSELLAYSLLKPLMGPKPKELALGSGERILRILFRARPSCLLCIGLIFVGLAGAFPGTLLRAQDQETPLGEFFQIKLESLEGKTRVVLKVRHPVNHTVFSLTNPDRVVINLTPCILKLHPIPELKTGPIQRLRCSQFNEKTVRLVLDMEQKAHFSVSTPEGDPFQLWIDLPGNPKRSETPASAKISKETVPLARSKEVKARGTGGSVKKIPRPASEVKVAVVSATPDSTPKGNPPEPLLETGRELLEQKKYVQGREVFFHYLNVVSLEKLDLRVVEEIYHSYRLEGNAPQGEKARRQILQAFSQAHGPAARPAISQLIDFYIESKQSPLALQLITQLKSFPQEKKEGKNIFQSQLQRALIPELEGLFTRANYKEVIRLYHQHREALQDCPEPRLFVLLGKSIKALGLPDLAGRYFQAAWQRGNQEPQEMLVDWAEVLIEKGDQASAAPLLRKLIDHPSVPENTKQRAYLLLGQGWHRQRDYVEALKILEESIARYPSPDAYPERWYLLGSLYYENPALNCKADEALRKFILRSQDPAKTALAYEKIGDLFFREGKVSEAREAFQQAQQLNRRPASPFLTQKIIQCRLLLDPKGPESKAANPARETDFFWTKVYESRAGQQTLDKKISDLRLN